MGLKSAVELFRESVKALKDEGLYIPSEPHNHHMALCEAVALTKIAADVQAQQIMYERMKEQSNTLPDIRK
jgi:hypothetical protein